MTVNEVISISKAVAEKAIGQDRLLFRNEIETTDATATDILTIEIEDQSAGILQVWCAGFDATDAVTGMKQVRYKKVGGTLTLGTVGDVLAVQADGALSAATFGIIASSNNIAVQVTGVAATAINWKAEYKLINVLKEAVLP